MNFNNEKVSLSQMGSILVLTMVGTGILTLPRSLAEAVGTDGWLLILIGGAICIGLLFIHSYIVKSFPGKSYMEIIACNLSKPVSYVVTALLAIYFIGLNAFLIRIFSEVVKMFLLLRTPIEVIIFSIVLMAAYLARQGIETLGRLAELLLPLILVPSLILFLLAMVGGDITNLLPAVTTTPKEILEALPIVIFSYLGFDIILIFGIYVNKPNKVIKSSTKALVFVVLLYTILNIVTISTFGEKQTTHLIWPTISLFKTIEFPGLFIENVEGFVMALWVLIVFMSIAPLLLVATTLLGDLFTVRDNKYFALPLLPLLYFIALLGDSLAEAYAYLEKFINYTAPFVLVIIPVSILISMFIRRRLRREGNTNV